MSKLDLKEILELNDDNKIYEFLFEKVFELGKEIIKLKKMKYEVLYEDDRDKELYYMSEEIYYNSIWFESYRSLVRFLYDLNFCDVEEENDVLQEEPILDLDMDNQEVIQTVVKIYNEIIDEIDSYNKQNERIKKEGLKNLEEKLFINLREIFCKMLDYKNRKYNKNGSLGDLIGELVLCYSDYKWMFDETYTMLKRFIYKDTVRDDFWIVKADDVEYISSLEFTYNFFSDEENYKNYKQYYEDITLKEGQTLENLYDEEKEKLKELFVEMLEFINIEIEDKNNYYALKALVEKYYPYYNENFIIIDGAHTYSYIDLIHTLKINYDYFKRTFKNHKEDYIHYVKKEEEYIEKSKHSDILEYDDFSIKRVEELKSYFKEYFED